MGKLLFILFLIIQFTSSYSQKDSLLNALQAAKKSKSTKEIAKTCKELAKTSYFSEYAYDTTLKYSDLAIPLYKKLKNEQSLAYMYKLKAYAFVDKELYHEGLAYLDSALTIYETKDKLLPIIQVYTNKGIAYSFIDNNENSVKAFQKAIDLSIELADSSQLATNLLNIGIIYNSAGEYALAIEHLIKACEIFEKINDSVTIVNTYLEIGDVYQAWDKNKIAYDYYTKANKLKDKIKDKKVLASLYDALGYTSEKQDSMEKAISFYKDVLELSEEIDYKAGISQAFYRLGNINLNQKKYQPALNYYTKSLEIERDIGSVQGIVYMKNLLASTYTETGRYAKSLGFLRKARSICLKNNFRKNLSENNLLFYKTFKNMGLSDSALFYYEKHVALEDSIYGEKQEIIMEELREKYEAEKKENTILNLNMEKQLQQERIIRQKQRFVAFTVVFIFLLIIGLLLYLQQKRKEENRKLQIKQQLFRSQMNPHFIFNALNSIKNFMLSNEKQKAADYMIDFSQLMRQVLDGSVDELKILDSEISLINNYLNLQCLRYNHAFIFEIRIDDKISSDQVLFPSMFLQPFIENAVVHGIAGGGDKITVEMYKKQDFLTIKITDNGPGYYNNINSKDSTHKSMALKITRERIKILKKLYKWKVEFDIGNLNKGRSNGTIVNFQLPYREIF